MASGPSDQPPNRSSGSNQDELEAALAALRRDDTEPSNSGVLNQAAIDALLAREASESMVTNPPEEAALQYDRLDAPIAPASQGAGLLTQADLDAALAGERPESTIDALLAREAAESVVTNRPEEAVLEHDRLDAPVSMGSHGAGLLTQADLDAILAGEHPDSALDNAALDDVLSPVNTQTSLERAMIEQSEIDKLIAAAASQAPPVTPAPAALGPSTDELAALLAKPASAPRRSDPSIGAENLAAAANASQGDVGLSQDLLDALLAEAEGAPSPPPVAQSVPVMEPVVASSTAKPAPPEPAPTPPPPAVPAQRVRPRWNVPRLVASLAAGLVVGLGTYLYVSSNPYQDAGDPGEITGARLRPLEHAKRVAQAYIDEGEFAKATAELEAPLAAARPSRERTDAEYVYLDAAVKALSSDAAPEELNRLHNRIDSLVEGSRSHDRAPEALVWKAHLYERQDLPIAATAVYRDILQNHRLARNIDEVLYDAGANALALKDYKTAAGYLQRLMNEHGSSPLAGPGKLLLGDAYHGAGQTDSARVIYIQVAESHVNSPLGGEAHARLGNLAYEEGRYQDAIDQLELRREQATSVEGNEQVYLLLAKAHRAAGNPAEAEVVLRELIDFFPENPYTPEAYVELSQVLEERGMRQEALRLARRTALSYPGVPLVLRNEGELLSKAGVYAEAAEALVAAEAAGDKDPKLLLRAAQNYQQADDLAKASEVYEDLITRYAVTPEAFEGGIALAQVDYERGQLRKSLERLERLATVSEGKPQYLPVMTALGDLYSEIGLDTRAAQAYSRVAAVATEPETLARAATALLTAGSVDEGMTVADRVDRTKVSAAQAYELLMRHGEALLRVDPDRALSLMEEAYATYPEEHTPAWGQRLLDAYLTSDRSAYARRLVMDMEADARQNQAALPNLVRGAVAYGDYLYGRQDYRAAADAYALIPETADVESPDVEWSRFQRANALLQLGDFEGSIPLFDAVASAKGRWAKDAALKGKYGRLEQRMRGMTVTPAPGQMAQAAP